MASGLLLPRYPAAANRIKSTFLGKLSQASGATTYNFGNLTVPRGGILILIPLCRGTNGNRNINSVSAGGVAATLAARAGTEFNASGSYYIAVAAGTPAVSVVASGACAWAACYCWLIENAKESTPYGSAALNAGSGTSASLTMNLPVDGLAFFGFQGTNGPSKVINWSSADDVDQATLGSDTRVSGAEKVGTGASHTETVSWTGGNYSRGFAGISWR